MDPIIQTLIMAAVISLMVALGSQISFSALIRLHKQRDLVLRSLLGTTLLFPLLGGAVLILARPWLNPASLAAIALMLICPSAPLSQQRAAQAGGDHLLAVRIQLGAAIVAIVTVPLLVYGYTAALGTGIWSLSPLTVAAQVLGVQVVPVLAGMLWTSLAPTNASRWRPQVVAIAQVMVIAISVLILIRVSPLIWQFFSRGSAALLVMLALIGLALGLGQVLAGRSTPSRTTVGVVTAMRNPGLALLLAHQEARLSSPSVLIGILSYLLLTLIVLSLYQKLSSRPSPA